MPTGPARPPDPNAQIRPGCRRLRVSQRRALGRLAYLRGQAVYLVDFATCRVHPLSGDGTRPLRFSGDGAWLGFYDAIVAGVFGLQEEQPFGSAIATGDQDRTWSWAPMGAVLAGATNGGGVMIGAPGRPRALPTRPTSSAI